MPVPLLASPAIRARRSDVALISREIQPIKIGLIVKIPNGRLSALFSRRRVLARMSAASLLLSWVSGGKVLKERGQRWAA